MIDGRDMDVKYEVDNKLYALAREIYGDPRERENRIRLKSEKRTPETQARIWQGRRGEWRRFEEGRSCVWKHIC